MSRKKLNNRIENAINAFFENAPEPSKYPMAYTGETALAADEKPFAEKADKWHWVLREVFMFGPGVFSLFFLTLTITFFYPTLGLSPQGLLMYFFAAFLTYAGSGSIAKVKNLLVPATVIVIALAFAFLSPLIFGRELSDLYFWDSIYLFPFVLIAAKLVQSSVADKK